ncbi:hypothetical protein DAPPUDRAFT_242124 [Daphnia pulex]|uniref:Uncharacterized protein n=1 Tax=Daphnia pulex TaxID=6669 RepID=E9GFX9_DAPPU|nr:hypothetical protein DAPPUDRAFT_242124 [Daphnia pulex]|eukprot:EFX81732.1 hypothetical protein DAPPUDRAFT_242124 [Daphnia pulex]
MKRRDSNFFHAEGDWTYPFSLGGGITRENNRNPQFFCGRQPTNNSVQLFRCETLAGHKRKSRSVPSPSQHKLREEKNINMMKRRDGQEMINSIGETTDVVRVTSLLLVLVYTHLINGDDRGREKANTGRRLTLIGRQYLWTGIEMSWERRRNEKKKKKRRTPAAGV